MEFSKYPHSKSTQKQDIDVNQYVTIVKTGLNQDLVLMARSEKEKGNEKEYKNLKATSQVILGSCVMNDGEKTASNIKQMNGLIVIDIDVNINNDTIEMLKKDKYSFILHRSFGGEGVCIFVKINSEKFIDSFNGLADYYFKNYGIVIDQSCKNPNRLRYISYDPDLYLNEKSIKFIAKANKEHKEIKEQNFIYTKSDFDNILEQIKERNIDLCKDEYHRYIRIGFALFDKFGSGGIEYFNFICSFGTKYDQKAIDKHYKALSKNGQVTISTFYHYCKEEGIDIYTQKTKDTIQSVKIQKSQGNPSIESVVKHLEVLGVENPDTELIKELILSKKDFSKTIDNEDSNISQLEKYILSCYQPETNTLTNETYLNTGERLDDKKLNDIYINAVKIFDFNVSKNDVRDILNSNCVPHFDPIKKYFIENKSIYENEIEKYINCVEPKNDYNIWAFKKWLVGCVHNWISGIKEPKVSPLTLVLCGQKQGTGKTSFFRELLPTELNEYLAETKIDLNNKDSVFNLSKSLIVLDDEFGGLATRDVKDFKKMADTNIIDMRLPYGSIYSKFKRRASLAGTSNETNILKDVTGNRRILPIQVHKIDYNNPITIDKDALWKQAYDLYKNSFDWKIYKDEDVNYLNENTIINIDVNPIEELFFNHFSLIETSEFSEKEIVNQGEILNFLNINTGVKATKFDVKDIFVKNKLEYKTYKVKGNVKCGIAIWKKPIFMSNNSNDAPF
jgi:predicted P-loop ATPase